MEHHFPFKDIESRWAHRWKELKVDSTDYHSIKEKMYVLEMLPYPSGKIHMGHVRNYSIGDTIARYYKLNGYSMFHPIGWDAFGLPAENAAINQKVNPQDWTHQNIAEMKKQLQKFGLSYDWNTELATCSPEYYRWNQWLFLQFYRKGLAYKKYAKVNFCPQCETVLANEQVIQGRCWRCDSIVEMKNLSQWYLKITEYASQLLSQHELLKGKWPDRVLSMQKQWIGESQGADITFQVRGYDFSVTIFTTRPETLFGATYLALAPEHPFIQHILERTNLADLEEFVNETSVQPETERSTDKKGLSTGFFALHPYTKEPIPIYVANFVLASYGHGAVMGVPAHDSRDQEFARIYNLPSCAVIQTISENGSDISTVINSGEFSGQTLLEARKNIIDWLTSKKVGKAQTQYRLRDWLISRQRYWGTPIPIVYCEQCGMVPIEEKDLPVLLPTDIEFNIGKNPILSSPTFLETSCPHCGKPAKRETDTMDTFVDSSWYFMRYTSVDETASILNKEHSDRFLPVDYYIGGIEHAVLHLMYARFVYFFFKDLGLVNNKEPFQHLITQGMVLSHSYYCPDCKVFYAYQDMDGKSCPKKHTNIIIKMDKMSKSKNNGVDPELLVQKYGADASRLFMLFAAPIDKDLEWNDHGVVGCFRFLKRIYSFCSEYASVLLSQGKIFDFNLLSIEEKQLLKKEQGAIHKIQQDMSQFSFNTCVATLMELWNALENHPIHEATTHTLSWMKSMLLNICILLFPLAPHTAEECYHILGGSMNSLGQEVFPTYHPEWSIDEESTYVVQINGKYKGTFKIKRKHTKDDVIIYTQALPFVIKLLQQNVITDIIYVPHKIVNLLMKPL